MANDDETVLKMGDQSNPHCSHIMHPARLDSEHLACRFLDASFLKLSRRFGTETSPDAVEQKDTRPCFIKTLESYEGVLAKYIVRLESLGFFDRATSHGAGMATMKSVDVFLTSLLIAS